MAKKPVPQVIGDLIREYEVQGMVIHTLGTSHYQIRFVSERELHRFLSLGSGEGEEGGTRALRAAIGGDVRIHSNHEVEGYPAYIPFNWTDPVPVIEELQSHFAGLLTEHGITGAVELMGGLPRMIFSSEEEWEKFLGRIGGGDVDAGRTHVAEKTGLEPNLEKDLNGTYPWYVWLYMPKN